jgi:hypothetical protein
MSDVDWQAVFFKLHDVLMGRARKRFGDSPDAESAYNYALETIMAKGFDALGQGYAGRGSPEGFVVVRFVNLMHDYATAKYGRPRPPAWLVRLGTHWKRVFELHCLRRMLPETVVDMLHASADLARENVRSMIREVRARVPGCGQAGSGESLAADPAALDTQGAAPVADACTPLDAEEMTQLVGALHGVLGEQPNSDSVPGTLHPEWLPQLRGSLRVDDDERLLLRLIYQQGYSISKAARALQLKDHNARRLHARLLERLRAALQSCGLAPLA